MVLLVELVGHQVTVQHQDGEISRGCVVEIDDDFIKLVNLDDEVIFINISDISRAKLGLSDVPKKEKEKGKPQMVMARAKPPGPQYQDTSNRPGLNDGGYEMPSFITEGGERDFIQESD